MTRSMRSFLATHNLLAVSALHRETTLNVEQELDTSLLVDLNSILQYRALKSPNREEMTGREEPDRVDDLGGVVAGTLSFSRAQPQHFAFLLAYALGHVETTPLGGSAFRHTIRPLTGEVDVARSNPSFTAAMRFGRQVLKRRFASCFIDQVRVDLPKDGWAKIHGGVKGTGKITDNTQMLELTAPFNTDTLVLAGYGVAGDTAQERLSNVQAIKVQNPASQAWEEVSYSAVSQGVPALITITPPGGSAESASFRVYFIPVENGWMTLPPQISEPPLKVSDILINLGGRWDGAHFLGGHTLTAELGRLSWTFHNHLVLETTPGGETGYANRAFRTGREQKVELDRDFRDFLLAWHLKNNDTLALYVRARGPEFAPGYPYQVELVFPRLAVTAAPIKVGQRRLLEEVALTVLEDQEFGSVIAYVQNQVPGYAA